MFAAHDLLHLPNDAAGTIIIVVLFNIRNKLMSDEIY